MGFPWSRWILSPPAPRQRCVTRRSRWLRSEVSVRELRRWQDHTLRSLSALAPPLEVSRPTRRSSTPCHQIRAWPSSLCLILCQPPIVSWLKFWQSARRCQYKSLPQQCQSWRIMSTSALRTQICSLRTMRSGSSRRAPRGTCRSMFFWLPWHKPWARVRSAFSCPGMTVTALRDASTLKQWEEQPSHKTCLLK